MNLTRADLSAAFVKGGVADWVAFSAHLNGNTFATVSRAWVSDTWAAGLRGLRMNAPRLVEPRAIGGGKTVLVPRYLLNGFCCRGHALFVYAHGLTGFADAAAEAADTGHGPLDHDAIAFGLLEYTATPRPENLLRSGRHENLWFVDHDGVFQTFEPGDGSENEMTSGELASITFLYAQ